MVRSTTSWKPLTACLVIGLVLASLPGPIAETIRSRVVDVARPGQQAVLDTAQRLADWRSPAQPPRTTDRDRRELDAARLEISRLRLANSRLTQETTDAPSADPQHPPLVTTDLVTVRVLGQETIQAWQAGRILDRGRGLSAESLVVEPGHTTLDLGQDRRLGRRLGRGLGRGLARGLARGQPAYAGRRVAGRISRVGLWTSTLQPLTDTRFRGLARLARPGRDQPVFSTRGMLEGTGDGFCRLTLVPATAAVAIGDVVYTDGRDQPDAWPMVYGTVVQAELPDGAPHWEIRIRPAIDLAELKQLDVLTRRFHRPQANSQGVLAQ